MNRGEVVQVDWPYSDLTGSKSRPAVVVQADYLNGLIVKGLASTAARRWGTVAAPGPGDAGQARGCAGGS
jgi:mRNA-degrading endonuclease toxin of MazEF toxin-antitoxin module